MIIENGKVISEYNDGVLSYPIAIPVEDAIEGLNEAIEDATENHDYHMADVAKAQLAELLAKA